jgi:hypothetical protein
MPPSTTPAKSNSKLTPEEVREAFAATRRKVGSVFVEPFSLGIVWLFEEIKHPYNETASAGTATGKLSIRDIARAIFIFNDSQAAAEALARGIPAFDAEAARLARTIEPADLPAITAAIADNFAKGLAAVAGNTEK